MAPEFGGIDTSFNLFYLFFSDLKALSQSTGAYSTLEALRLLLYKSAIDIDWSATSLCTGEVGGV